MADGFMEQVTEPLRAWADENLGTLGAAGVDPADLAAIADEVDQRAEDEVAYAVTQTRNEYEGWIDPTDAERMRGEYYDQGFSDGYEAAMEERK